MRSTCSTRQAIRKSEVVVRAIHHSCLLQSSKKELSKTKPQGIFVERELTDGINDCLVFMSLYL